MITERYFVNYASELELSQKSKGKVETKKYPSDEEGGKRPPLDSILFPQPPAKPEKPDSTKYPSDDEGGIKPPSF